MLRQGPPHVHIGLMVDRLILVGHSSPPERNKGTAIICQHQHHGLLLVSRQQAQCWTADSCWQQLHHRGHILPALHASLGSEQQAETACAMSLLIPCSGSIGKSTRGSHVVL